MTFFGPRTAIRSNQGGEKLKKWKMLFAIGIVLTIIFMVLCGALNADNTREIWQIMKVLFSISLVVDIVSIIGCIVASIKNKEKMPTWLIIIIVLVVVFAIMWGVSTIMDLRIYQKFTQKI